jgi:hypothetical protein
MSNATAQDSHAVRSGAIDQRRICTLSSDEADLRVGFAPELGMLACSMLHSGEELLGQRSGVAAVAASRSSSTRAIRTRSCSRRPTMTSSASSR